MNDPSNLFSNVSNGLSEELFITLLESQNVRIERIVSYGNSSPEGFWYDQDQAEWVIVLQGAARLALKDRIVEFKPGDFLNLPAHEKHRVEWTTPDGPTIWLAIHYSEELSAKRKEVEKE